MKRIFLGVIFYFTIMFSFAQDSLNVTLLYHWSDSTIFMYNEVWGFVQDGREYAVIGTWGGTYIIDVTDPVNSTQVEYIPGTYNISVHRDYHDYNGYLYMVSDEGASTLQIADLSYLPDSAPVVYDSDTLFVRSHNIFIDTATAKLFVCGGGSNQLSVYSLADPINPVLLVNCGTDVPFWGSIGYIHDIYVKNDIAYCNAFYASGLFVVDFSSPQNPQLLGSYMDNGQNHSGWLSSNSNVYVLAREKHTLDVNVYDVSNLANITLLSQINSGVDTNSIAHNLIIRDDFLYLSYYYDGLQIFDISNPSNPVRTGYYDTYPLPNDVSYNGAWGVYPFLPSGIVLVSDMRYGLFIFDVSCAVSTNTAFSANDDIVSTDSAISIVIDVKSNDINASGVKLITTVIAGPTNGTAIVLNGDSIEYFPDSGFTGIDTIIYVICNNCTSSICDTAAIIIVVKSSVCTLIATITGNDETIPGVNDGIATVIASDGTLPYTYIWNTGDTGSAITDLSPGDYIVTVFDSAGCTYSAGVTISTAIGIKESDNHSLFNVFPNPFSNSFTVLFHEMVNTKLTFELFDLLGRRILSERQVISNSNKYIIKTGDLPGGIYILEVRSKEIIHHQKIIKAATDK